MVIKAVDSTYRELVPAPSEQAKVKRQRKAELNIRNVQAKERLFTLAYVMLIIVSMTFGTLIGYWFGRA